MQGSQIVRCPGQANTVKLQDEKHRDQKCRLQELLDPGGQLNDSSGEITKSVKKEHLNSPKGLPRAKMANPLRFGQVVGRFDPKPCMIYIYIYDIVLV